MVLRQTPSQTIGPFFAYVLTPAQFGYPMTSVATNRLADAETEGERIRILGRVLDGGDAPVGDAMVEIWHADASGRYADPARRGFGRSATDADGRFVFHTVKPGPVGGGAAPHVNAILFMRGLLCHLYTRIYFADESRANAADPTLARVPEERRATLVARREQTRDGVAYRFDIRMQGKDETVFFQV